MFHSERRGINQTKVSTSHLKQDEFVITWITKEIRRERKTNLPRSYIKTKIV